MAGRSSALTASAASMPTAADSPPNRALARPRKRRREAACSEPASRETEESTPVATRSATAASDGGASRTDSSAARVASALPAAAAAAIDSPIPAPPAQECRLRAAHIGATHHAQRCRAAAPAAPAAAKDGRDSDERRRVEEEQFWRRRAREAVDAVGAAVAWATRAGVGRVLEPDVSAAEQHDEGRRPAPGGRPALLLVRLALQRRLAVRLAGNGQTGHCTAERAARFGHRRLSLVVLVRRVRAAHAWAGAGAARRTAQPASGARRLVRRHVCVGGVDPASARGASRGRRLCSLGGRRAAFPHAPPAGEASSSLAPSCGRGVRPSPRNGAAGPHCQAAPRSERGQQRDPS
mmetsp:Transcript_30827/g.90184  ORF Transcript_30827/g.90184 Transcript_30827/m.90184 type:complete len:351 (-) Transcript_30827:221-1273(-)